MLMQGCDMMSKRDEQAKETKQKIIESARLLIREQGIENVWKKLDIELKNHIEQNYCEKCGG